MRIDQGHVMNRIFMPDGRSLAPRQISFNRHGHLCRVDAETGAERLENSFLASPESQKSLGVMNDSIPQSACLFRRENPPRE